MQVAGMDAPLWLRCIAEAAGLGAFMLSAGAWAAWLEAPRSRLRRLVPSSLARRAIMGLAMGATALAIFTSPLGAVSGAQINPAVTLAFWSLGRIGPADAALYAASQLAGAIAGTLVARAALGRSFAEPPVSCVVTVPGPRGPRTAFVAEAVLAFVMMSVVLATSGRASWARWTPGLASALVAVFITFEAPLSGMSINPARTLGSAVVARRADSLWVYLAAPALGMLLAALLFGQGQTAR